MQSQVSTDQNLANVVTTLLLSPPLDGPQIERESAELREAWVAHQVNPLGEIQSRGVPYSALRE